MTKQPEPKRLYKSTTDKMLAGVCGGIAEYFDVDPTLVRVITVLITLFTSGGAIIAYIALAVIVPRHPDASRKTGSSGPTGPILDKK